MWGRSYFFGLLGAVVILLTASFSLSITLRHPRARIMWKYPISLDCWQPGDSCHFIYCSLRPFNHAPTPQGTDDVGAPYFWSCWQPRRRCYFIYCSLRPLNHAPTPQGTTVQEKVGNDEQRTFIIAYFSLYSVP